MLIPTYQVVSVRKPKAFCKNIIGCCQREPDLFSNREPSYLPRTVAPGKATSDWSWPQCVTSTDQW